MSRSLSLAARALACALACSIALPASASEAADRAAAQKLMTQGNQLVGDGEYLGALARFREAYARYPSAKILLNIAATLRELGRNVEAAEMYEKYLADPSRDPSREVTVRRSLYEIDLLVGTLRIQVSAPDATIKIDGKDVPGFRSGGTIRVEPGDHSVVAQKAGFPAAVATPHVGPHEEKAVSLVLTLGPVKMERVYVEGPQRTIAYVVGGVGIAGLAAGGIAGIVAILKNKSATSHCEPVASSTTPVVCDPTGVSLGNQAATSATISTVTLAVGGAALATGVILYLTVPGPKDEPAARARVEQGLRFTAGIDHGGGTLRLGGSW